MSKGQGEPFFFLFALFLLAIVTGGFSTHALVNPDQLPQITPVVIVHAAVMGSWFTLFALQAGLAGSGRYALHKRLGILSLAFIILVPVLGWMIMLQSWHSLHNPMHVMFNLINIASFALLCGAALMRRKQGDSHKRLMLFASIALMAPALARVAMAAQISETAGLPLLIAMIAAVFVYDLRRLKRIHPATWIGGGGILVTTLIGIYFGLQPGWLHLAERLLD